MWTTSWERRCVSQRYPRECLVLLSVTAKKAAHTCKKISSWGDRHSEVLKLRNGCYILESSGLILALKLCKECFFFNISCSLTTLSNVINLARNPFLPMYRSIHTHVTNPLLLMYRIRSYPLIASIYIHVRNPFIPMYRIHPYLCIASIRSPVPNPFLPMYWIHSHPYNESIPISIPNPFLPLYRIHSYLCTESITNHVRNPLLPTYRSHSYPCTESILINAPHPFLPTYQIQSDQCMESILTHVPNPFLGSNHRTLQQTKRLTQPIDQPMEPADSSVSNRQSSFKYTHSLATELCN
jgi:hypothetical protein